MLATAQALAILATCAQAAASGRYQPVAAYQLHIAAAVD